MSLARRILGNTFWQIFGRIVTAVIAFLSVGFLTNYWGEGNIDLGQAKYGTYAYIYDFLTIFGAIADLGIFTIAVREMSRRENDREAIFASAISLRIVTLLLAMLVAIGLAFLIPQYAGTEIPRGIAIAAFGTALFILSGTLSAVLLLHLQMRFAAVALVLGKILTFGLMLLTMYVLSPIPTAESFYSLIWAGVWGSLLTLLMTWYGARKFLPTRPRWNPRLVKELFLAALPFGIATFVNTIYFRLDSTLMGIILPHSQADGTCLARFCGDQQVGIYAVAVRIMEVLNILPVYFMNSILPSLMQVVQNGKKAEVERHLALPFFFLLLIALPAAIGLFLLAQPVVELVTPPNFGSHIALEILVFPLFFIFLNTFFSFVLIAYGKQKNILWINFIALSFNLLTNLWAIPRYGFRGAAVTTFLSEGLILILMILSCRRTIHFPLLWKRIAGAVFSAVIMGVFTFLAWRYWGSGHGKAALALIIPVAGAIYALFLLLTKAVDKYFFTLIRKEASEEG